MRDVTKDTFKFVFGFMFVVTLSAFLTPWLYSFLPFKFDRVLRRLIMIGTIILMMGLIRARRQSLSRLGLGWREDSLRLLLTGFAVGVALVAIMSILQWALGARFWQLYQKDIWHWMGLFFKALGGGLLIGLIEEFFFRGFLFLTLKDLWGSKASLVITNLIYSLVHFFPKGKVHLEAHPTFMDSFRIYMAILPSSGEFLKILPGILGLFFFGLALSFIFLQTGSLFSSIGIHSGAVFALKLNRRFLPEIAEKMGVLSGSQLIYDGISGMLVLFAMALFLGIVLKRSGRNPGGKERKLSFGLVLLLFVLFSSVGWAETESAGRIAQATIYSFIPFLHQARATRVGEGKSVEERWSEGKFHSDELPSIADIYVSDTIVVAGTKRSAIWFQPVYGYDSSLEFSGVPPGRSVRLFYSLPDSAFQGTTKPAPVQFELWVGGKKLFEALVGTKGWQEKKIDLTLPFFLQRKHRFSFHVRTADRNPTGFVFYAFVE